MATQLCSTILNFQKLKTLIKSNKASFSTGFLTVVISSGAKLSQDPDLLSNAKK
jgi:hypothetical protein